MLDAIGREILKLNLLLWSSFFLVPF